ncbi:GIN domain-containing protein [Parasphingopyxis marina]|uniref:DUF2807 domain-containing protein n=1 Tax=Parasphingopyxis marina TaxID=2761622 RepID=A0A842HV71_9SPHN|nr:DUF2807 domain-containing protein [Parasphingopyxis marina]MBC2776413.1 DUF2807 domain-containing protein [Parasphingopyxis marina]
MRTIMGMIGLVALAACNSGSSEAAEISVTQADGEGATVTGDVALEGFDQVALRGPDNVDITIGDTFSVRAEGPPEVIELLEFELHGDRLEIGRKNERWSASAPNGRATIHITMPMIRGASVAGSGDMTIDRAEAEEFEASVAGSGNIALGELRATSVEFDIAGSGDIRAAGSASDVEIGIAGSGNVRAGDLRAERLDISVAGSGDVDGYATERVEGNFIGSGDATIRGGARCNARSIGSGSLRCS